MVQNVAVLEGEGAREKVIRHKPKGLRRWWRQAQWGVKLERLDQVMKSFECHSRPRCISKQCLKGIPQNLSLMGRPMEKGTWAYISPSVKMVVIASNNQKVVRIK